jgi:hypothetical protein
LSLTAASTVAGFFTRGEKAIRNRAFGLIRKRDPAHRHLGCRTSAPAFASTPLTA